MAEAVADEFERISAEIESIVADEEDLLAYAQVSVYLLYLLTVLYYFFRLYSIKMS